MGQQKGFKETIDSIIDKRKKKLPEIVAAKRQAQEELKALMTVQKAINMVLAECSDSSVSEPGKRALEATAHYSCELSKRIDALGTLERSFNRNTINIAVSGAARSGKSTTLQKMSGLTDEQLPSGSTKPLTAVTSRLFNSDKRVAEVTFRSKRSFVTDYLTPHLNTLNEFLSKANAISVTTIDEFAKAKLPDQLEGDPSVAIKDSLARLKDAQTSLPYFQEKLTGKTEKIPLSELKQYVAYPTNEDENMEERGEAHLQRLFLAVDDVKIFHPFPVLDDARIGLVDLPGLGEVSDTVAHIHTKSLTTDVDQIFLIAKPSQESGYVDRSIGEVIDRLREIQPGVDHRCDLIAIGINVEAGSEAGAKSLRDDIRRKINSSLPNKQQFTIHEYSAIDPERVAHELEYLLQHIANVQPHVDKKNLVYAMSTSEVEKWRRVTLLETKACSDALQRLLPNPLEQQHKLVQEISGAVIDAFEQLEHSYEIATLAESETHQLYNEQVDDIHNHAETAIKNNLFLHGKTWKDYSHGESVDPFSFYRSETRRIRRELVSEYCCLDRLYDENIERFKRTVLETLLQSAGLDCEFPRADQESAADEWLAKVDNVLGKKLRDQQLHEAFELLRGLTFQFRSNVFLKIANNLDNLKNPPSMMADPGSYRGKIDKAEYFSTGSIENRMERVHEVLMQDAIEANDSIAEALHANHDGFGETLEFYASCFNDYLYRRDVDHFKYVVIRGIVENFNVEIPDETKDLASSLKRMEGALTDLESATASLRAAITQRDGNR
ncbi:hypothetical protein [Enorma sp.]|uniref:hypothetical protein n=1 Tax=Enorma sp. TaxID=1920692 RepID=UPI003AB5C549